MEGGYYLSVEYGHRSVGFRERSLDYCAGRGCFWLRQRYPRHDQSEYPSGFLLVDRGLKWAQDAMINQADYVELGLACADVCTALDRGLDGKRLSDLNDSVCQAINQLTT